MNSPNGNKKSVLAVTSGYMRFPEDIYYKNDFVVETVTRLLPNFDMHVLAPRDKGNRSFEVVDGVKVHRHNQFIFNLIRIAYGSGAIPNLRVHPWKIISIPFYMLYLTLRSFWIIRQYKIDTVHLHWLIPHGLPIAILKHLFFPKLRIVGTAYGADILQDEYSVGSKVINSFIKYIISQCDSITTCSQANKRLLEKLSGRSDIEVIPVGVDSNFFNTHRKSNSAKTSLGIQGTSFLFVGSLIERKGIDALVAAVPAIKKVLPDFN